MEIANWRYENDMLTIYMRKATIKSLEGTLIDDGEIVPNQKFTLKGEKDHEVVSDDQGRFSPQRVYSCFKGTV